MTVEENKQIAHRLVEEVWNDQQLDVLDELYSADYVGHWLQPGGKDADREAVRAFIASVHEAFPDYHMETEFVHGEGDLVTFGFEGSGTHEGEFMGIPPSEGAAPSRPIPGHVTMRIEDGTVVEGWSNWDALGLLQELGALPEDLGQIAPAADD